MSCLPKPVLRGHIRRRGLKGIIGALTFGGINGALFHFFIAVPRQKAVENFIKTYEPETHYKELLKYGYISLDELKAALLGD